VPTFFFQVLLALRTLKVRSHGGLDSVIEFLKELKHVIRGQSFEIRVINGVYAFSLLKCFEIETILGQLADDFRKLWHQLR